MNQVKWRVCWRDKNDGRTGMWLDVYETCGSADEAIRRFRSMHLGESTDCWVQPEEVEPPKPDPPKPPETSWRMYWRLRDGRIGARNWRQDFVSARADCEHLNRMDSGAFHWIQPDGTEPALKPGTDPVRWRVHYRNRLMPQCTGSDIGSFQTMAAAQAGILVGVTVNLDFWIQPELATAEPDYRLLGCRATAFSAFDPKLAEAKPKSKPTLQYCGVEVRGSIIPGHEPNGQPVQWNNQRYQGGTTLITVKSRNLADALDAARADQEKFPDWKCWIRAIEPADKPEPCHAIWKVWCQQRTGGTISLASASFGVTLGREAAENLAKKYGDGSHGWRYWAQPACEEAKAPPLETLYRIRGVLKSTAPETQPAFDLSGTFTRDRMDDEIDRMNRQSSLYHFWPEKAS